MKNIGRRASLGLIAGAALLATGSAANADTAKEIEQDVLRAERIMHDTVPGAKELSAHAKGILVKKALASGHACLGAGQDPVRASFELVFDQPGVAAAIVGTINPLHLAHNVAMAAQALKKA